ncbi:hypothetical protein NEOLEDRAFT_1061683 [Neolentinus lepideus HHB14362 ss-1]|uniref:Zn(2)-C6 fungal-type domain-containing protein n=1 Tax=Neolentinus lepideus HHB14362 ss-1 TaxID=1314782 RepID=A0A165TN87_9AGAM|nr:hypothetical protein NEOLEDRAFT_1061683 [Neolentinus lepideus HHB14362 ss-1]
MALPDKDDAQPVSLHPKKKRPDDQSALAQDLGSKPLQLQRRRVWRACESCRRKKIKCDGCEPTCSQCASSGSQCTWLQTKDRAALSRHYVQELEQRLLHMETLFTQVTPVLEHIGQLGQIEGVDISALSGLVPSHTSRSNLELPGPIQPSSSGEWNSSRSPNGSEKSQSQSPQPVKMEDDVSESFGQLALDEHGSMRWIGGSSTMSLIQSFRALTTSPLHRVSPMEEDPRAPGPSANKLYFPASVYFGKVRALPSPEDVEYPERDLADKLVDAYFTKFHFLLPVIDKPTFLRQYEFLMNHKTDINLHRTQTGFISLVFAVFACAAQLVNDPRLAEEKPEGGGMGMIYYERALILQYISHASIQMAHVQCFLLLSSFLCSVNCLPQAWLIVGQAVRIAQDLGLHRSPRRLTVTPIEKETRRKTWWGAYTLDRMLALALGRPLGVEDADCDVELPVEYDDEQLPEYFQGAQINQTSPSLVSGFVALTGLYSIAGRVLREVYSADVCKEHLEPEKRQEVLRAVESLDRDLTRWCDELPNVFKSGPQNEKQVSMGAVLCSHYYSILTSLHRNFLPVKTGQPIAPRSTARAVSSARACIRLAPSIKNVVPPSHHLAFFIQHLFSSAVIILLYAMHVTDLKASHAAMEEVSSCLVAIESWEGSWPGARKCKELLSDLYKTATSAIQSSAAKNAAGPRSPALGPTVGPTRRRHSNQMAPPDRSLTESVIRNRSRRAFSPDSNQSPRRAFHAAPYPVPAHNRARSTSRRRGHDEPDGSHDQRASNQYMQPLSSSFPGQSHMPTLSPHSSPASVNSLPSPIMPVVDVPQERSPPRIMTSTSFGPMNAPVSPTSVPLPQSPHAFDFNFGMNTSSMSQPSVEQWNGGNNDLNGLNFFPSGSQSSNGWQGNSNSQNNFINYDGLSVGMNGMSASSATFDASGLPFRGLDLLRNYNPSGYPVANEQDGLWQTFDAGAFRYDPDMPFTIGDLNLDNGHVPHG